MVGCVPSCSNCSEELPGIAAARCPGVSATNPIEWTESVISPALSSRRVLFVGKCHALVLREMLSRFCKTPALFDVTDLAQGDLTNTIVERAAAYDAVIFIHADYTYEDKCRDALATLAPLAGYKFVTLPPLSWLGYYPGLTLTRSSGWCYEEHLNMRHSINDVDAFVDRALELEVDALAAISHFDACNRRLREFERKVGCSISLSEFIERESLLRRLFLMPTHCSNVLYVHICNLLSEALDLVLSNDIDSMQSEVQADAIVPILPGVERALSLQFRATEYVMHFATGLRAFSWREWLTLLFYARAGAVYLSPGWGAQLEVVHGGMAIQLVRNQVLYALKEEGQYVVLDSSPSLRAALPGGTVVRLVGNNWEVRSIEGFSLA